MASDLIPNSYQTPNAYVDRFMFLLTPEEWKVLSYAARRIFGFQKRQDRISQSQFTHGTISKADGHQLDRGTGLSKPTVIKALNSLIAYHVMREVAKNDSHLNHGALYELELDSDKIDIAGLIERANQANQQSRKQSAQGRKKAAEIIKNSQSTPLTGSKEAEPVNAIDRDRSMPLTGIGQCDRPGSVNAIDTQNQGETKIKQSNGWMNDPICKFLIGLPGYNNSKMEADRAAIVANHYSVEGLEYLFADCDGAENPIGLFLYRVGQGQQSPAYLDVLAERKRLAAIGDRIAPAVAPPEQPQRIEPDASLTQPLPGHKMTPAEVWQTALGELQLEMTRATFETWVKPTCLLSVNGTWQIGVKNAYAKEWLDKRLMSTIRRVMTGIVGESVTVEFVEVKR